MIYGTVALFPSVALQINAYMELFGKVKLLGKWQTKGRKNMEKLYNEITKNIKRYSNNFENDMRKYIENKKELHDNINTIDYYMTEISEAIEKKNWLYIYDIMENNLFFEYIQRDYIHKMLMKYLELYGAAAFIENLRTNLINSSSTTSYVFVIDFIWR